MSQLTFFDALGCTLTKRTLTIPPALTDASLNELGSKLLAMRGCLKWALGALLHEMLTRRMDDERWCNEFADAHDIDPKDRREMLALHLFYPPASRTLELSYEHYREAMLGIDDGQPAQLKRALLYLQAAQDNNWSHTQLRRHIRSSQATEQPDPTQSEFAGYGAIYDFRRYIQRESAHPITPDRARLLLKDIGEDTIAFIDNLRSIAAQPALTDAQ